MFSEAFSEHICVGKITDNSRLLLKYQKLNRQIVKIIYVRQFTHLGVNTLIISSSIVSAIFIMTFQSALGGYKISSITDLSVLQ